MLIEYKINLSTTAPSLSIGGPKCSFAKLLWHVEGLHVGKIIPYKEQSNELERQYSTTALYTLAFLFCFYLLFYFKYNFLILDDI